MSKAALAVSGDDLYPFDAPLPPHSGPKPLVKRKLQRGEGQL